MKNLFFVVALVLLGHSVSGQEMKQKHGIKVGFQDDKRTKSLDSGFGVLLYQAVRELLINVAKHAEAHEADVSISRDGEKIRIEVSDDGIGCDNSEIDLHADIEGGFGLFSIRERLEPIGGLLKIESEPGNGTKVTLTAPLGKERPE